MESTFCDRSFGPRVDTACRQFDFTLYFEDLFLAAGPSALFLLLSVVALYVNFTSKTVVKFSWLLIWKAAVFFSLPLFQLALLVIRTKDLRLQTDASLAADTLCFVAALTAAALTWLQHHRSEKPSTVLSLYLTATTLTQVARARTIWLIGGNAPAAGAATVVALLTAVCLAVESREKVKILIQPEHFVQWGPEPFVGFWAIASYTWVFGLFRRGYSKSLNMDDLPQLAPDLRSTASVARLESVFARYDKSKKYSLLKACFRACIKSLLAPVIPRLLLSAFTFAQPFMISEIIEFFDNRSISDDIGRGLIGGWTLVFLGIAFSRSLQSYYHFHFLTELRGSLISLIYSYTLRAKAVHGSEIDGVTLMGADVEAIVTGFFSLHDIWASLMDMTIAIYLLQRQMSYACIVPAIVVGVGFLITTKLSTMGKTLQRAWIEKLQERIELTSSILGGIRAFKMLGLTDHVSKLVKRVRDIEISGSRPLRILLCIEIFLSNVPSQVAPLGTFALFLVLSNAQGGNGLLISTAFTSLSLISLVTTPAVGLIQSIQPMIQCLGSFDRIQEFCLLIEKAEAAYAQQDGEQVVNSHHTPDEEGIELQSQTGPLRDTIVNFRNKSFTWKAGEEAVLRNVTTAISKDKFTVVLGTTGSGKSTFLESILRETVPLDGDVTRNFGHVAYCSQVPWLINGTIRDNIIGTPGLCEDYTWYNEVVAACGLKDDLENMSKGDKTLIGDDGGALSGGQRQRVSLARAVYSRYKVVLLDDIFSGIDSRNVVHITNHLLGPAGLLRRDGITTVLVTHASAPIAYADDAIVFENGEIVEQGSFATLRAGNGYVSQISLGQSSDSESTKGTEDATVLDEPKPVNQVNVLDEEAETPQASSQPTRDFSVYKFYSKACDHRSMALFMGICCLWVFCATFDVVVINWWSVANSESNGHADNGKYLGAYALLVLGVCVMNLSGCWLLFVTMVTRAATRLHHLLLESVLGGSLRFFNVTDIGDITNRFTQDLDLAGMNVPILFLNCATAFLGCIAQAVLLAVYGKYLTAAFPFMLGAVFVIQRFYLRTSKQVRMMDIEAKAPVYLQFLETKKGAASIRALGWQKRFADRLEGCLDASQRAVYMRWAVVQWLSIVIDLLVVFLAIILVITLVLLRDSFQPGVVGVALLTVMQFNERLSHLILCWTSLEINIGAVSRIQGFIRDTVHEEKELKVEGTTAPPENWPSQGAVEFKNVVARYSPESQPALKNLSLRIEPGKKTAICGPSGSGKTSFLLSIAHMIDVQGSLMIDDVDIANMPISDLRSRINVVPQEPFLMPGSVRFNIDPFDKASDADIEKALRRLNIWDQVQSNGGLESKTTFSSWSVGERQLLCLARAMVRKSKLIILDEATSSVDTQIEAIIQDVLETEFAGHTVLSVVHRLGYIRQYDRVLVLKHGEIAEYDTPQELLARPSILSEMVQSRLYDTTE